MNFKRLLKEPLVHFLAAGALLFAASGWIWPQGDGGREEGQVITIGEADLLAQLQDRAQLVDEAGFRRLLAEMSDQDRAAQVRDAAVSEALYREGTALGLVENDPLIRARVIQQMRLLLLEEEAAGATLTDNQVRAWFAANQPRYAEGARVTFSHVFFSAERRGAGAEGAARASLAELNGGKVAPADAGRFGDRFAYQTNYAEAGASEIAGQFGPEFATRLLALRAGEAWQGPLQGTLGWHVVRLANVSAARVPPFAEIAERVREDALADERARRSIAAIDRMMAHYQVRTDLP